MRVGNLNALQHKELISQSGEHFSFSAVMTDPTKHKGIFVHHEIIPPGRRASAPHSHSMNEEVVVVLSGKILAHLGEEICDLDEGAFVVFAPGGERHFLENVSEATATCLIICTNQEGDIVQY